VPFYHAIEQASPLRFHSRGVAALRAQLAARRLPRQVFAGLGEDAQAEVIAKVELLRLLGPRLGRPHADTVKKGREQ
jgi:hypothetical protein